MSDFTAEPIPKYLGHLRDWDKASFSAETPYAKFDAATGKVKGAALSNTSISNGGGAVAVAASGNISLTPPSGGYVQASGYFGINSLVVYGTANTIFQRAGGNFNFFDSSSGHFVAGISDAGLALGEADGPAQLYAKNRAPARPVQVLQGAPGQSAPMLSVRNASEVEVGRWAADGLVRASGYQFGSAGLRLVEAGDELWITNAAADLWKNLRVSSLTASSVSAAAISMGATSLGEGYENGLALYNPQGGYRAVTTGGVFVGAQKVIDAQGKYLGVVDRISRGSSYVSLLDEEIVPGAGYDLFKAQLSSGQYIAMSAVRGLALSYNGQTAIGVGSGSISFTTPQAASLMGNGRGLDITSKVTSAPALSLQGAPGQSQSLLSLRNSSDVEIGAWGVDGTLRVSNPVGYGTNFYIDANGMVSAPRGGFESALVRTFYSSGQGQESYAPSMYTRMSRDWKFSWAQSNTFNDTPDTTLRRSYPGTLEVGAASGLGRLNVRYLSSDVILSSGDATWLGYYGSYVQIGNSGLPAYAVKLGIGSLPDASALMVKNYDPQQPAQIVQAAAGQAAPLLSLRNASGIEGLRIIQSPGSTGYTLTDDVGYSSLAFSNGNGRATLTRTILDGCSLGNSAYPEPWLLGTIPNSVENYIRMSRDAVAGGGDVNIFTQLYASSPYPRLTLTGHGLGFYVHGVGAWPEHAKSGSLTAEIEPVTGNWKFIRPAYFNAGLRGAITVDDVQRDIIDITSQKAGFGGTRFRVSHNLDTGRITIGNVWAPLSLSGYEDATGMGQHLTVANKFGVGINNVSPQGQLHITNADPARPAVIGQAAPGQTAPFLILRNSSDVEVGSWQVGGRIMASALGTALVPLNDVHAGTFYSSGGYGLSPFAITSPSFNGTVRVDGQGRASATRTASYLGHENVFSARVQTPVPSEDFGFDIRAYYAQGGSRYVEFFVDNASAAFWEQVEGLNFRTSAYKTSLSFKTNGLGVGSYSPAAELHVFNSDPAQPGIIVRGAAGQSVPLLSLRNSSDVGLAEFRQDRTFLPGYLQVRQGAQPVAGAGVEIAYLGGYGLIQAYDRDTSQYKPIAIAGALSLGDTTANSLSVVGDGVYLNSLRFSGGDQVNTIWQSASTPLAITTNGGELVLGRGVSSRQIVADASGVGVNDPLTITAASGWKVKWGASSVRLAQASAGKWQLDGDYSSLGILNALGVGTNAPGAQLHVQNQNLYQDVAVFRGAPGQVQSLSSWQDSSGNPLAYITSAGGIVSNSYVSVNNVYAPDIVLPTSTGIIRWYGTDRVEAALSYHDSGVVRIRGANQVGYGGLRAGASTFIVGSSQGNTRGNSLRVQGNNADGNTYTVNIGVSEGTVNGLNYSDYGFIQTTYDGSGSYGGLSLVLNPQGGAVGIGYAPAGPGLSVRQAINVLMSSTDLSGTAGVNFGPQVGYGPDNAAIRAYYGGSYFFQGMGLAFATSSGNDVATYSAPNRMWLTGTGYLGLNVATPAAQIHVVNSAPGQPVGIDQAAPGQTASLREWRDSSGNVRARVNHYGAQEWIGEDSGGVLGGAAIHINAGKQFSNGGYAYPSLSIFSDSTYSSLRSNRLYLGGQQALSVLGGTAALESGGGSASLDANGNFKVVLPAGAAVATIDATATTGAYGDKVFRVLNNLHRELYFDNFGNLTVAGGSFISPQSCSAPAFEVNPAGNTGYRQNRIYFGAPGQASDAGFRRASAGRMQVTFANQAESTLGTLEASQLVTVLAPGQSANAFEVRDASDVLKASISPTGALVANGVSMAGTYDSCGVRYVPEQNALESRLYGGTWTWVNTGAIGSPRAAALYANGDMNFIGVGACVRVNHDKVLRDRQAAVTTPDGTLADATRAIKDLIARLDSATGHGLIAA